MLTTVNNDSQSHQSHYQQRLLNKTCMRLVEILQFTTCCPSRAGVSELPHSPDRWRNSGHELIPPSLPPLRSLRPFSLLEGGKTNRRSGEANLLSGSGHVALGFAQRFSWIEAALEVGGRFGGGVLKGASNRADIRPKNVKGGVGGPLVRLWFKTRSTVFFRVSTEVGYAAFGITGRVPDDSPIQLKAFYTLLLLAIGVNLN